MKQIWFLILYSAYDPINYRNITKIAVSISSTMNHPKNYSMPANLTNRPLFTNLFSNDQTDTYFHMHTSLSSKRQCSLCASFSPLDTILQVHDFHVQIYIFCHMGNYQWVKKFCRVKFWVFVLVGLCLFRKSYLSR